MNKITLGTNGKLVVPDQPTIPFIIGDGNGKEIIPAMMEVIDTAVRKVYGTKRQIKWKEALAGENAFKQTGSYLPKETIEKLQHYLVSIKGPLVAPIQQSNASLNIALYQALQLYACIRPVRWYQGVLAPVLAPEKINMTIFRENTEDVYCGVEWHGQSDESKKVAIFLKEELGVQKIDLLKNTSIGIKAISQEATNRVVRAACHYALKSKLPSVTIVHNANMLDATEGDFRRWAHKLIDEEFADAIASKKLIVKDKQIDSFAQNVLICPEDYSVIVTTNQNGDFISNQLAGMVGGNSIVPKANINFETGHAIFEGVKGTVPELVGKNIADPCSLILSGVMLLEYIGWDEAASLIKRSIEKCFEDSLAVYDLARFMPRGKARSTFEFTHDIIERINI